MKCVRRPKALADVDEHASFNVTDSVDSAIRFLEKIEETVDLIRDFPECGGKFVSQRQELSNWLSIFQGTAFSISAKTIPSK